MFPYVVAGKKCDSVVINRVQQGIFPPAAKKKPQRKKVNISLKYI